MFLGIYIVVGVINILATINDFNIPNTPEFKDIRVRRSAAEFEPSYGVNKVQLPKYDIKRIFDGKYFKERAKRSYPSYQQGYVSQVNTSWNNNGFYPGYYDANSVNTPGPNGSGRNNYSGGSYNGYPGLSYPGYYQYPNSTYPAYNTYPVYTPYVNISHPGYRANLPYPNNTYPGNNQYPGYTAYIPYPNNTYPGSNQNPGYTAYIPYSNNTYSGYNPNQGNQYPGYNNANYNTNTYSPYNNTGYGYPIPGSTTPGYNSSAVSSTTPRVQAACIFACNIQCPKFMKRIGLFCVNDDDDYD